MPEPASEPEAGVPLERTGASSAPPATSDAHRPIDGPPAFRAALYEAFATLARTRPPEIRLCDADFSAWPLGDPTVLAALTGWAGANRRLVLLGRSFDTVARCHPRWVAWRRTWSHLVSCRTNVEVGPDPWPTLLVAPGRLAVLLIDPGRCRGWSSTEPRDIADATERFDALLQRSVEAFPATTLGL